MCVCALTQQRILNDKIYDVFKFCSLKYRLDDYLILSEGTAYGTGSQLSGFKLQLCI